MARPNQLLDHRGQPVQRRALKEEIATARIGTVRSPISGSPGDGLDPVRLANILRAADQGDPLRYLELAETVEERNLHYLGVLGTRRRSVTQIPITVEPASDAAADVEKAEMIEKWLKRQELQTELFDILDAVGKGYSFTEIIWDTSSGQWRPERLEYRDPRWFRFDRNDLLTPVMLGDQGQEEPLPAFKFIYARMQAKSGLPIRSGLARAVMWGHLFKLYSERDWAIFSQTYGQPLRLGKWQTGASEDDKDTLFRAVANIAGDCAAIIPESMQIDFVETGNKTASSDLYKDRADWYDQQVSKAVLGQTATTDAVTGGLGSGEEHRQVQEDIEQADCMALSAILTRDLARPWCDLEFGPGGEAPQIKIGRPEPEDMEAFTKAISVVVPMGLPVSAQEVYTKLGLTKPGDGDEILGQIGVDHAKGPDVTALNSASQFLKRQRSKVKYPWPVSGPYPPEWVQRHSTGRSAPLSPVEELAEILDQEADAELQGFMATLEGMLNASSSLEEFAETVRVGFPDLDSSALTDLLALAMTASHAAGMAQVEDEDG